MLKTAVDGVIKAAPRGIAGQQAHGSPGNWLREVEQRGEERGRVLFVVGEHDGVVERDKHDDPCRFGASKSDADRHRLATLGRSQACACLEDKATAQQAPPVTDDSPDDRGSTASGLPAERVRERPGK